MSHPFIIWTMQRTGGTALTDLLMAMSEHKKADHEPFNRDRQFGAITAAWGANKDESALARALAQIFSAGYLIKHTYELRSKPLNAAIMRAAKAAGYRQILLLRRDEFSRLVSKFVAEANGTWFKDYAGKVYTKIRTGERSLAPIPIEKIVSAYRHCRDMTDDIRSSFETLALDFYTIDYEELYAGERAVRLARLDRLFDFLEFPPELVAAHRSRIDEKILAEGFETRSIIPFVPNFAEVVEALRAAGCEASASLLDGLEDALAKAPASEAPQAKPRAGGWNIKLVWEFQRLAEKHGAKGPFLEIGSNLMGPAILSGDYFAGQERHGIDLDQDTNSSDITRYRGGFLAVGSEFRDGYFSTIFSNAALEHDGEFWRTLKEMKRLLTAGGLLMVAVPGFRMANKEGGTKVVGARGNAVRQATPTFRVHGPTDYWRFSPRAIRSVIFDGFDVQELRPLGPLNWMIGVGAKPEA